MNEIKVGGATYKIKTPEVPEKYKGLEEKLEKLWEVLSEPYNLWMCKKWSKTLIKLTNIQSNILRMKFALSEANALKKVTVYFKMHPDNDYIKCISYPRDVENYKEKNIEKQKLMNDAITDFVNTLKDLINKEK
jgi:hypothetical protein